MRCLTLPNFPTAATNGATIYMTKRTCWLVILKIQMYLSNVPEQGLCYFSMKEIRK